MSEDKNKLGWVALREQIAAKTNTDPKVVKVFLEALVDTMSEALANQDNVRITGLGTFRSQQTATRKSVNVRTGEQITIPSYNRISFTSEASLQQTMNYQPPTLSPESDPLRKLSEQADEIVDILADLGQSVKQEQNTSEFSEISDNSDNSDNPEPSDNSEHSDKKPPRPFRPWLTTGIVLVVFCLMLIGAYFFLQMKLENWINTLREKTEITEIISDEGTEENISIEQEITYNQEVSNTDNTTSQDQLPEIYLHRDYSQLITIERITPGSRLAWIAKKYYGNKELWVFLYEANQDHLSSPSNILIGTPIRVPKLDERLMDMDDENTQALIEQLKQQFISKH